MGIIPVAAAPHPLILAHRGGAGEATENTWAAFRYAAQLGVTHLETDAQVTADGQVVLSHDETLERMFGRPGRISDYTYAELSRFRTTSGDQLPLLREVLEELPQLFLNIDAKTDEVVAPLLAVLAQVEAFDRVLIASFSEQRLQRVRALADFPELTTSLGVSGVVRLFGAARTASNPGRWGVPGVESHVRAVQVPRQRGMLRVVDRRLVAAAHRLGLAVHVWTVNEAEDMVRLLDLGVDGIVTDYPSLLKEILIARGQWPL